MKLVSLYSTIKMMHGPINISILHCLFILTVSITARIRTKIWYCTRAGVYSGALFPKAETERKVCKSLKIGMAYKTRMRWQMSLQRLDVRLPQMQTTTSERVPRPEGRRSDDRATPSLGNISVGETRTECESGAMVELHA